MSAIKSFRKWVNGLWVMAVVLPLYCTGGEPESVELVKGIKPGVLLLLVEDESGREVGSGTGFFVSGGGQVVTNFHVVAGAASMEGQLADGRKIPILGILAEDQNNDIAILQADYRPTPSEILPLAALNRAPVEPGERVYVVGAPKGLAGSVSEGVVSAIRKAEDLEKFEKRHRSGREPLLQITAAISGGSSGSPVVDKNGQAIGVAVSNLSGGQNLNFAVPIGVVHLMRQRIGEGAAAQAFKGRPVWRNLLISIAVFVGVYLAYRRLFRAEGNGQGRRPTNRC